jgi:two-component system, OmpR family, response regulator ChvI
MVLAHDTINSKLKSENLPSVSYRISADYGRVEVATSVSSKGEDLFGSTMNICAKINLMAEPNGVVIGGDLYQIVRSFNFSNDYEFNGVKGYSVGFKSPYSVYAVLAKNRIGLERSSMNPVGNKSPTLGAAAARLPQQKYFANVMVVDDEPDILFTYKSLLSAEGYNVKAFTDPQDALSNLAQLEDPSSYYQLALLDIRMPRLNGLQLFYRIKAISRNTKIIFCSALDIAEEVVSILPDIKNNDIIKKPVTREYFVSKINSALNNSTVHFDS